MIAGIFLLFLSLITENIKCSSVENICKMESGISIINYKISENKFRPSEIKNFYCEQNYQPARSGKKSYYVLKVNLNSGETYSLGSYQKYKLCKNSMQPLNKFLKHKIESFNHNSNFGFSNLFGMIFAILMFFIGFMIIRYNPETEDDIEENSETEE